MNLNLEGGWRGRVKLGELGINKIKPGIKKN
jgi:hypothetical protein